MPTRDLLSLTALASNRPVNVFIARDGAEIGEFPREKLGRLAREGQVQPNDYYWHEGMESWLRLSDLLGSETWKPREARQAPPRGAAEVAAPPEPLTLATLLAETRSFIIRLPQMRRQLAWIGGIFAAFLLLAALVIHSLNSGHSTREPAASAAASNSTALDPDSVRDQAAADLRQRIDRLPGTPVPPSYSFYYGVRVTMERSFASGVPWTAIIRGGENAINPETQQTTLHTDFILVADYRDGEWTFQRYRASASDMLRSITTEIEDDEKTPAPPSIVGILGLKTK